MWSLECKSSLHRAHFCSKAAGWQLGTSRQRWNTSAELETWWGNCSHYGYVEPGLLVCFSCSHCKGVTRSPFGFLLWDYFFFKKKDLAAVFSYCTYNCSLPEFVLSSLSILIPSLVLGNPRYFCLGAWSGRRLQQQCSCTVEISWWCLASAVCCTMQSPGSSPTPKGQLCLCAWTKHFLQTFLLAQSLSTALMRIGRSVPSTCSLPALIWLFGRCWLRVRNFQRNLGQMETAKHPLKTVSIRRTAEPRDLN